MVMQQARIVVAEDELIIALDLKRKLERLGHRVLCTVTSGSAAIAQVGKLQPDLLIMDIGLSGDLNGLNAVEIIRKTRRIPVIFVSAYSDTRTRGAISLLSPASLLVKPVADAEIRETVEQALTGE